ncbi:Hypothetical predicted protein [Podarcis lilfordi]|uniref:Uncharacterized protein n=1 Tax=Podarcis lilfordi TaxID=74358 RepID=A0AA35P5C1_9SAUR|nr:Hypothetical predicted protein [Podarcis lilfordi]
MPPTKLLCPFQSPGTAQHEDPAELQAKCSPKASPPPPLNLHPFQRAPHSSTMEAALPGAAGWIVRSLIAIGKANSGGEFPLSREAPGCSIVHWPSLLLLLLPGGTGRDIHLRCATGGASYQPGLPGGHPAGISGLLARPAAVGAEEEEEEEEEGSGPPKRALQQQDGAKQDLIQSSLQLQCPGRRSQGEKPRTGAQQAAMATPRSRSTLAHRGRSTESSW